MIVLGFDVSSSSTGIVEVTDGKMTDQAVWKPPKKTTVRPASINDYFMSITEWLRLRPADLAVVVGPAGRSFKTIRAISHFESITFLVLERRGVPIKELKDSEARNWVLGLPIGSSKEEAHAEVRRRYPDLRLPPINQGGGDVADAYVAALAGPEAMRRQR